jgi:hypothetical protein
MALILCYQARPSTGHRHKARYTAQLTPAPSYSTAHVELSTGGDGAYGGGKAVPPPPDRPGGVRGVLEGARGGKEGG